MPVLTRPGYADLIRNTPGLVGYWRMRDLASSTVFRNELTTAGATMQGTPTPYQGTPIADGAGAKFNGTNQAAYSAIDLSAYAQASISFWMYWDSYTVANKFAYEFNLTGSVGFDSVNGAGFVHNPDGASGAHVFGLGGSATGSSWLDNFPAPSAAVWHHYLLTFNRATPVNAAYVDGVTQTLTTNSHVSKTYGNFANGTGHFVSRTHSTFWGPGRLSEVALFGGVLLTTNDARNQYQAGIGT